MSKKEKCYVKNDKDDYAASYKTSSWITFFWQEKLDKMCLSNEPSGLISVLLWVFNDLIS